MKGTEGEYEVTVLTLGRISAADRHYGSDIRHRHPVPGFERVVEGSWGNVRHG